MPRAPTLIPFLALSILFGYTLIKVPLDLELLASRNFEDQVQADLALKSTIAQNCRTVLTSSRNRADLALVSKLSPPLSPTIEHNCTVNIQRTHLERFHLRSYWSMGLQVASDTGALLHKGVYVAQTPLPFALWPLGVFVIAILFEISWFSFSLAVTTLLLDLFGLNMFEFLRALPSLLQSAGREPLAASYLLLAIWAALAYSRRGNRVHAKETAKPESLRIQGYLMAAVGLWNPIALTLAARLWLPVRRSIARLVSFFDAQLVLTALSLYLFSFDSNSTYSNWIENLLLPRYFTFAILIFMALHYVSPLPRPPQIAIWKATSVLRAILAVVGMEAAARFFSLGEELGTLTRVSIALVASELLWPFGIRWNTALRLSSRWGGVVIFGCLISVICSELGAVDLVLLVADPRMHPVAIVLFTFVGAWLMAFATGSFSLAFFSLWTLVTNHSAEPLVRAAILDGTLCGLFLSPLSLWNLLPAGLFRIPMGHVIRMRIQQLFFPILIGTCIYAVAAVNSMGVLRPASFIFLCLAVVVLQLQRKRWKWGDTPEPGERSDVRSIQSVGAPA